MRLGWGEYGWLRLLRLSKPWDELLCSISSCQKAPEIAGNCRWSPDRRHICNVCSKAPFFIWKMNLILEHSGENYIIAGQMGAQSYRNCAKLQLQMIITIIYFSPSEMFLLYEQFSGISGCLISPDFLCFSSQGKHFNSSIFSSFFGPPTEVFSSLSAFPRVFPLSATCEYLPRKKEAWESPNIQEVQSWEIGKNCNCRTCENVRKTGNVGQDHSQISRNGLGQWERDFSLILNSPFSAKREVIYVSYP